MRSAYDETLSFLLSAFPAPHPRIVNVSSGVGALGARSGGTPAYSRSQAALNALTLMLAADLRGTAVKVNAVCPGWVATDIRGARGRPVAEGTAGVVWAATLPDNAPTGGFFRDGTGDPVVGHARRLRGLHAPDASARWGGSRRASLRRAHPARTRRTRLRSAGVPSRSAAARPATTRGTVFS